MVQSKGGGDSKCIFLSVYPGICMKDNITTKSDDTLDQSAPNLDIVSGNFMEQCWADHVQTESIRDSLAEAAESLVVSGEV